MKLNKVAATSVANWASGQLTSDGQKVKLTDTLIAQGYGDPKLYSAPGENEDRTFYDSLKAAVVKGFPAEIQALIAMTTKAETDTLTKAEKEIRRESMQKVGAYMAAIRNSITKRAEKPEGGNTGKKTPEQAWIAELDKRVASLRNNAKDKPYDTLKVIGLAKDLKEELSKTA